MKDKILALFTLVVVCAYPCLFIYLQNIGEGRFTSIIDAFMIYFVVAMLVMLISGIFFKKLDKTTAFTSIFMLIFLNFNLIYSLSQKLIGYYDVLYMEVAFLIIGIILAIAIKKCKFDLSPGCNIVMAVMGGLIVLNFLMAIPNIISNLQPTEKVKVQQYAKNTDDLQNIYYLILDEYGGTKCLEYYYDFDNSEFEQSLLDKGFSYSQTSYNRESISTVSIIPNILNLDYVTEPDGGTLKNVQYTKDPVLYRFFKDMGYQINVINHVNFLDTEGCNVLRGVDGDVVNSLSSYVLENSMVYSLLVQVVSKTNYSTYDVEKKANELEDIFDIVQNSWKESKDKPTLTVAYIQCPHTPFVYNSQGEYQNVANEINWVDKDIYIGQLEYLNERIEEIVQEIKNNDPNAVIVLQSDHGARYGQHCMYLYDEEDYDEKIETENMQNVLNCVYWGKNQKIDINGLSGINTWRTILNTLYGTDYDMLPEPEGYIVEWEKVYGIQ